MTFKKIATLLAAIVFAINSFGQKALYKSAKIAAINELALVFEQRYQENQKNVELLLAQNPFLKNKTWPKGQNGFIKGVNTLGEPIIIATESNLQAGITTNTGSFYKGGSLGIDITGAGIAVKGRIGVWDGGKILNTHAEFDTRATQMDNPTSLSTHATHVSGTIAASGVNAQVKGMAPGATFKAWDFNNDDAEMATAAKDLLISNHSYGQVAGWVYNENRSSTYKWEWYGNNSISAIDDYKFGFYDEQSRDWDKLAVSAPYYLIVKSAGNSRNQNGPGLNADKTATLEPYYLGSGSDTSRVIRSRNDTYDNIVTYGVAKNILTVGAVNIVPNGPQLATDIKISSFSSWGPTDDGRIKPDIVGVGVNVLSTASTSSNAYAFLSGTSMSSPQVSGSLLLLQDLYSQRNNGSFLKSSSLKGLALHTAIDAGNKGPDYSFGWGLLDMEAAGKVLINTNKDHIFEERNLSNTTSYSTKVIATGTGPLKVTICWTDPEATATVLNTGAFNSRTPKLVNDLDIRVKSGDVEYLPWILNPEKPEELATTGNNVRDNVEQVFIENAVPGKEYTITISHKGVLRNNQQEYALLVSGVGGKAYCNSRAQSTADTKIESIALGKLQYKTTTGCKDYTDFTGSGLTVQPNQELNFQINTSTCGAIKAKKVAIFADWNLNASFDDDNELVYTSGNLSAENVFEGKIRVPAGITVGKSVRVRIIATEGVESISGCSTYPNGETIDMVMHVNHPNIDLAVNELLFPTNDICIDSEIELLTLKLSNKGLKDIANGQITIDVYENETKINSVSKKLSSTLPALSNFTVNLETSLKFKLNGNYKFQVKTDLEGDENIANDIVTFERKVNTDNLSENPQIISCNNDTKLTLSASGKGATFWYDAPVNGSLLAVGNIATISKPSSPTTFYASLNDLNGIIGPKSKKDFAGGTYSGNFGPKPIFVTKAPIKLQSARLYIGAVGKITFTIERVSDLTPISSVTLNVIPTRNPNIGNEANGQQSDDPNDPGAVYNLGLEIPEAGTYQVAIEYEDGASIFRSNQGVTGFPFSLQNAVEITGSSFQNGTLTTAWYYFYNLKVSSLGCPSKARVVAQDATSTGLVASISNKGNNSLCPNETTTLAANIGANLQYKWYADNILLPDESKSELKVQFAGNYSVEVSNNGICPNRSTVVQIANKNPQAPFISTVGNVLTASEAQSYQWLESRNVIPGATGKSYTAFKTGNYSVRGQIDGCFVDSFQILVTVLAEENGKALAQIIVGPNPFYDNITFKNLNQKLNFEIRNSAGVLVKKGEIALNNPTIAIEKSLTQGFYFLQLKAKDKVLVTKLLKQ